MSKQTVHVIGGGMAGLAAATMLSEAGMPVKVYEAASQAGGRCRSYFDTQLNTSLDNGNHLIFSGNKEAIAYLRRTGGIGSITQLPGAVRFIDADTQETWETSLQTLFKPWELIWSANRVPGTRLRDYLLSLRILRAPRDSTVEEILSPTGEMYRRFWEPFSIAVLNTESSSASANLLSLTLREVIRQGRKGCFPLVATSGLASAFVDPACVYIEANDGEVFLNSRCIGIGIEEESVTVLRFRSHDVPVGQSDTVIFALQQPHHDELLGRASPPSSYRPIVNVHYKTPDIIGKPAMTGIVGGNAEWIFVRGDVASVTISAATAMAEMDQQEIVDLVWQDVRKALHIDLPTPADNRVIKEKRATPVQSPDFARKRLGPWMGLKNCWRAGDWTDTGLPATIEGAIKSGHVAANRVLGQS